MAERTIDIAGRERLARLQPETAAERERTERVVRELADPELLSRCEARIDALLTGGDLADDPAWTARDHAFVAFTDQFVFSVGHVTDEQVAALLEHETAERVYAFVNALYVIDLTHRLELVAGEVLA